MQEKFADGSGREVSMSVTKYTRWEDVPDNLKTKTQLGKAGLRPHKDQKPVGVKTGWKRGVPDSDLFAVSEAIPKRQMSEAQAAALEKAKVASLESRTCRGCGYVEELGRSYRGKVYVRGGYCRHCRDEQELEVQINQDRESAIAWANYVLANPDGVLFLDTETTGLGGEVIELAITDVAGNVLFDSRFRPRLEIEEGAAAVHGLTAEMLANEPTWADRYEELRALLVNARVVLIFNAYFDVGRIWFTCRTHNLDTFMFNTECVMLRYAQFCGEWSRHRGSYRWQPLPGGDHSALGDCRAAAEVVRSMAAANSSP